MFTGLDLTLSTKPTNQIPSNDGWIPNNGKPQIGGDEPIFVEDFAGRWLSRLVKEVDFARWVRDPQTGNYRLSVIHWKPAGEWWVLHDGKGLKGFCEHVVILRDGRVLTPEDRASQGASVLYRHSGSKNDCIWYRVIEQQEEKNQG